MLGSNCDNDSDIPCYLLPKDLSAKAAGTGGVVPVEGALTSD